MYELLTDIATIAAMYLSITVAIYAILSSKKSIRFTETKHFIKNEFAKGSLILVALSLVIFFVFGMIVDYEVIDSDYFWFSVVEYLVTVVMIVALILLITRMVNRSYYSLLQNESPTEFESMFDRNRIQKVVFVPVPFETRMFNIRGVMIKMYPLIVKIQKNHNYNVYNIPFDKGCIAMYPLVKETVIKTIEAMYSTIGNQGTRTISVESERWLKKEAKDRGLTREYRNCYKGCRFVPGHNKGLFKPSIQDPVGTCMICSSLLNRMMSHGTMDINEIQKCIFILGLSFIYSRKHQDGRAENKLVGRTDYDSPQDSLTISLLATCMACEKINNITLEDAELFKKMYCLSYYANVNNVFAYNNWKFWKLSKGSVRIQLANLLN